MNKEKLNGIGHTFGYICGLIIASCFVAILIAFTISIVQRIL